MLSASYGRDTLGGMPARKAQTAPDSRGPNVFGVEGICAHSGKGREGDIRKTKRSSKRRGRRDRGGKGVGERDGKEKEKAGGWGVANWVSNRAWLISNSCGQ